MPLVRVEVRNEYGLGAPELYMEANREDPKEILEGVAVSGLVGILRQLGDLAEFAAEVFHGLQEQVTITSSRSHKLMGRVQRIEAALPSMEKLVLAQRSHLHFAYTTGANWHARVRCEQSHFIYSDLPRFVMDSYEQCQGPPRLSLLDKYDHGGPGSCLKRYSDPSFFRRASTGSEVAYVNKVLKDKKGRKIKKRRSLQKTGEVSRRTSMSNYSRRMQFASVNVNGQTSPSQLKSELGDTSFSLDSRNGSVGLEHISRPTHSMPHEEQESREFTYPSRMQRSDSHDYTFVDENSASIHDALKSNFGDRSVSLDSRNWTPDLEHESSPIYSMQREEKEPNESSCPLGMLHSDPHDHAFIDERSACIDGTRKSDFGNHSISLDSRNELVNPEHVSYPTYSAQHEEQESKLCYSSPSRMQKNDDYHFAFVDEKGTILCDDIHGSLSQEQEVECFSLTWDEKGQSLESASKEYDHDETLEMMSTNFNLENVEGGATHFETAGGYIQLKSSGKVSTELDQETEVSGAAHLETSKRFDHDESLETLSAVTAGGHIQDVSMGKVSNELDGQETEESRDTHVETSKRFDHDESLETISAVSAGRYIQDASLGKVSNELDDQETEESRATHLENSKRFDHDESLETLSAVSAGGYIQDASLGKVSNELDDQETEDSRATHLEISKRFDHEESLETLSANLSLEAEEQGAIQLKAAGQTDIHLRNGNLSELVPDKIQFEDFETEAIGLMTSHLDKKNGPVLISGDLHHDDVESETDNYMDALNTIESEYETDSDCQTRQEVEYSSDKDNGAIEHGVDMLTMSHSGTHLSNSESLIATGSSPNNTTPGVDHIAVLPETCSGVYGSAREKTSADISYTVPFDSYAFLQPSQIPNVQVNQTSLSDVDSFKNGDVLSSSNVKSVMSSVSSSDPRQDGSAIPVVDNIPSSSSELQKPPPEHSSVSSIKFWTNGSLLGLEPSKPPDFSLLNVASSVSLESKDDGSSTSIQKQDVRGESSNNSEESSTPDSRDDKKGGILAKRAPWKSFPADLGVNLQKLSDSCKQSYNSNSQNYAFGQDCGTVQTACPDIESAKASQGNSGNSYRMLQFGNSLFQNGFYRKPSLDKDEGSNPTNSVDDNGLEQKTHCNLEFRTFSGRSKEMLGAGSPIVSPPSSPPLGHMKISFQPMNGSDAPMQLKFPDGNSSREGVRDLFPSFQLVPATTFPLDNAGSDSDDDTFFRSSPYASDYLSHQSDSNSEQWESSESPRKKDRELYDALRRISLTESASTSQEMGQTTQGEITNNCRPQISFTRNGQEHSLSLHLFDLPSMDTLHTSSREELRNDFDVKNHAEPNCSKELTPSSPPLPPPQWQSMKPQFELAEDRKFSVSDNLSHAFDRKLGSTITQQPKPAPLNQEKINEAASTLKSQKHLQKTNGQKKSNQTAYGEGMEEKEDFLHQIRTKSFSLRRTVTAKPTAIEAPPKSVQVSAILEKANAIRQAVGSDDGEDDNWST